MEKQLQNDYNNEYRDLLLAKIQRRTRPVGLMPYEPYEETRQDMRNKDEALNAAEYIVNRVWNFHHDMEQMTADDSTSSIQPHKR